MQCWHERIEHHGLHFVKKDYALWNKNNPLAEPTISPGFEGLEGEPSMPCCSTPPLPLMGLLLACVGEGLLTTNASLSQPGCAHGGEADHSSKYNTAPWNCHLIHKFCEERLHWQIPDMLGNTIKTQVP